MLMSTDLRCGGCGYDLRGIETRVCPECGREFDPEFLIDQLMPWEQRRHIGRMRAYLRTIWLVGVHPTRAAEKIDRPMSVPAARSFRRVVWSMDLLVIAIAATAAHFRMTHFLATTSGYSWAPGTQRLFVSTPSLIAAFLGLSIGLWAAMCLPDGLFRSRRLTERSQSRALAMSAYACAALGWVPLPIGFTLCTSPRVLASWSTPHWLDLIGGIIAVAWLLLIALQWWVVTILLLRLSTACGYRKMLAAALLLPSSWAMLIFGTLAAAVIGEELLTLMRHSFA